MLETSALLLRSLRKQANMLPHPKRPLATPLLAFAMTTQSLISLLGQSTPALAEAVSRNINDAQQTQSHPSLINLINGQYIVEIQNQNHHTSLVATDHLTAKAENATLLVHLGPDKSYICVLKGCATIKNRLDHSVIQVQSGTVYGTFAVPGSTWCGPSDGGANPGIDSLLSTQTWLPVFKTNESVTMLSPLKNVVINKAALMTPGTANKTVKAHIVSPPTVVSYEAGTCVGKELPLPCFAAEHFPPSGTFSPQSVQALAQSGAGGE